MLSRSTAARVQTAHSATTAHIAQRQLASAASLQAMRHKFQPARASRQMHAQIQSVPTAGVSVNLPSCMTAWTQARVVLHLVPLAITMSERGPFESPPKVYSHVIGALCPDFLASARTRCISATASARRFRTNVRRVFSALQTQKTVRGSSSTLCLVGCGTFSPNSVNCVYVISLCSQRTPRNAAAAVPPATTALRPLRLCRWLAPLATTAPLVAL